jgi:hypothetical protein
VLNIKFIKGLEKVNIKCSNTVRDFSLVARTKRALSKDFDRNQMIIDEALSKNTDVAIIVDLLEHQKILENLFSEQNSPCSIKSINCSTKLSDLNKYDSPNIWIFTKAAWCLGSVREFYNFTNVINTTYSHNVYSMLLNCLQGNTTTFYQFVDKVQFSSVLKRFVGKLKHNKLVEIDKESYQHMFDIGFIKNETKKAEKT